MRFPVLAPKDPDARVAYRVDVSADLADLEDTLETATVSVVNGAGDELVGSDLIIESVTVVATGQVTFWLSGGSPESDGKPRGYYVRTRWRGARTNPQQTVDDVTVIVPVAQK